MKLWTWLKRLWRSLQRRDKVMYIGGSDTLPPPLERAEETALIARMDAGVTMICCYYNGIFF